MATKEAIFPDWLVVIVFFIGWLAGWVLYDVIKVWFSKMKGPKSDVVNLDDMEEVTDDK